MSESASQAVRLPEETGAAPDLFSKFDGVIAQRQALLDSGLEDPFGLVMERVLSPHPGDLQRARHDPAGAPTITWG